MKAPMRDVRDPEGLSRHRTQAAWRTPSAECRFQAAQADIDGGRKRGCDIGKAEPIVALRFVPDENIRMRQCWIVSSKQCQRRVDVGVVSCIICRVPFLGEQHHGVCVHQATRAHVRCQGWRMCTPW